MQHPDITNRGVARTPLKCQCTPNITHFEHCGVFMKISLYLSSLIPIRLFNLCYI
jgi:hypothetical protein